MGDESFMLMSLRESQSKKLAQVMSNETARKMLDYLATKEHSTETALAKELHVPLSTVHYNLKALSKAGLVVSDEYHYSTKGKEVLHYRLAKRYIIIAPKDDKTILNRLKKFFPAFGLLLLGTAIMQAASFLSSQSATGVAAPMMRSLQENSADMVMQSASFAKSSVLPQQVLTPYAWYFLGGGLFVLFVLIIWDLSRHEISSHKKRANSKHLKTP